MSRCLLLSLPFLILSACAVEPELEETSTETIVLGAEVLTDQAGAPVGLAADATHLHWIDAAGERLQRMSKGGGAIQTLATGAQGLWPWAIAVDASHVYWLDTGEGAVRKTPRAGGATTTLATDQGELIGIALDASHVYFSGSTASGGRVRRVAKWGGAAQTIATASSPSAIAADGFFIYIADAHVLAGSNRILRVPRSGGHSNTPVTATRRAAGS